MSGPQENDGAGLTRLARYLVPIPGLKISGTWNLGAVELVDPEEAGLRVRAHPSAANESPLTPTSVDDFLDDLRFASAWLEAESSDAAIEMARSVVEVLRVFQQSRTRFQTTMFGLSGDLRQSRVEYLALGTWQGSGWSFSGHHAGWAFDDADRHCFTTSPGFRLAVDALTLEEPNEAQRRALLAVRLTSQAILEHRPSTRLLYTMMAAEALLLERSTRAQSLRLARRSVYFLCGGPEGEICGRQRDTCPALGFSPETNAGRNQLRIFRDVGNAQVRWRCSEWHHVLDWYDDRSDVVHGGQLHAEDDEADRSLFWLVTRLLPAALDWHAQHLHEPIVELDAAIDALPPTPPRNMPPEMRSPRN